MGMCRLRYVIGLMSPIPRGPRRFFQWAAKLTRKLVNSSLGEEVYAFSEIDGHASMLRELYAHFMGLSPGTVGTEFRETLVTHLKGKKVSAETFSVIPVFFRIPFDICSQPGWSGSWGGGGGSGNCSDLGDGR